jgi:formylglycine-generating enzyme required for sulfatase activity
MHQRRLECRTKYANRPEDPEAYPGPPPERPEFVKPGPEPKPPAPVKLAGWPFDAAEAKKRQANAGLPAELKLDLGEDVALDLVLVPAGKFVMGSVDGRPDEWPEAAVSIDQPFYMGRLEVTNQQFACFDPDHDSAFISVFNKDQSNRGVPVNRPQQPVIRVSWKQAMAFCYWLSKKTGRSVSLPTEAQWEWACRAGSDTPMHYGAADANFAKLANFADDQLVRLCRRDSPKWIPHIAGVNDGATVTDRPERWQPNAWGLHAMHGNVAEWTRSTYKPYPYDRADGREKAEPQGEKVVRGGSFYDRPKRGRSAFRLAYPSWRRVFNVGFRVVCAVEPKKVARK